MCRARFLAVKLAAPGAPNNNQRTPTNMTPKSDSARYLARQEAAQQKHGYLTNDIVNISWHQPPRVNGRPLKLSTHGLTALLLLAERAVEFPGDYVPTEDIILAIEKGKRLLGNLKMSWNNPTPNQVHAAVNNVRRAIRKTGLNPDLVESVQGKGYRLSTPAMNIVINVPGAESLAALSLNTFVRKDRDEPPGYRRSYS